MNEKKVDFAPIRSPAEWKPWLGLLVVLALALSLRLDALAERYEQFPKGCDGSLEFMNYAEKLLDYTFEGKKFPPEIRSHQPILPLLLTVVFTFFERSSYAQYITTLLISLGLIVAVFYLLRHQCGTWLGLAGASVLALNAEVVHDAATGFATQLFTLLIVATLYLNLRQHAAATSGRAWLLGFVAAALLLTRREGALLLFGWLLLMLWIHRNALGAWLRCNFPLLLVPAVLGATYYLFLEFNDFQSYGHRIGVGVLTKKYMIPASNGIYAMPWWYPRTLIGKPSFEMTLGEFFLNFHTPGELIYLTAIGVTIILVSLKQLMTAPILVLSVLGWGVGVYRGWRAAGAPYAPLASGWVVVQAAIFCPVALYLGSDQPYHSTLGHRNHYFIPLMTLLLLLAGEGFVVARAWWSARRSWPVPRWAWPLSWVLVIGYYGLHHTFVYGQNSPPLVARQGEAEADLAFIALQDGLYPQALEGFDKLLSANPDYAPAHFGRAITLLHLEQPTATAAAFQQAIDIFPMYSEAYIGLASTKIHQGDTDGAVADLEECLRHRPDFVSAHLLLGYVHYNEGRYEESAHHYEQYLADVKALRDRLARSVEKMYERGGGKAWPSIERAFGTIDEIRTGQLISHEIHALGYLHLDHRGLYAVGGQGVEYLRPIDMTTYYNMGKAYTQLRRLDRAEKMLEIALVRSRDMTQNANQAIYTVRILNNLGLVRMQQGNLADFEALLQQTLTISPDLPLSHNNLGCLYAQLGQLDKARGHLESAASHPAYALAQQNLKLLQVMLDGGPPQDLRYDDMPQLGNPIPARMMVNN